jgi:hypothetical protein
MNPRPKPRFSAPLRHLIAFGAGLGGGFLGFHGGRLLAYAIAALTDRDIAALKDMLIWSTMAGVAVAATACVWLALTLMRSGAEGRRVALGALAVAVLFDAGLMLATFDWAKSSGRPVVLFELRLPAGLAQPKSVTVTLWRNRHGQGSHIAELRRAGDRPEVAGSFVIAAGDGEQMLSLQIGRAESYWRMPIAANAGLDREFSPWQRIEFVPAPLADVPPLPAGEYQVRYRVRRYM